MNGNYPSNILNMLMMTYNLKKRIYMKHSFLLIIFFLSLTVYSQSYEDVKKLDTIYIPFREGKYNIKIDYPIARICNPYPPQ
jgi:hypothetical protein